MNYKKIIWGVSSVATLAIFGFSEVVNHFQYIFDRLDVYSKNEAPEKIYLHTDKQYYTNGETIWIKSYLVNGITHTSSDKSKVSYIELISPKDSIVARRRLYTDSIGTAGDIQIGKNWDSGTYILRSYTNYMRNAKKPVFFQKEIPIWHQKIEPEELSQTSPVVTPIDTLLSLDSQFDKKSYIPKLKFYPEGGQLISGISNTIGILSTDPQGNGIPLLGSIYDEQGNKVLFRTYKYGLGKVTFIPKPNTKYKAGIIINGQEETYSLPEAVTKGYRLSVRNNGDHIVLDVETTIKNGLYKTLLMGHLRGKLFFKHIEPKAKNKYSISLLMKELDDGVAHFTLFTPSGEAVCERLAFIDNPENDIQLAITPNKKVYHNRERISIDVAVKDSKGNALNGDFSMSVISSDSLEKHAATSDIRSWLLLDSDLKGTIENPGYFFEDNGNGNRKFLLDALMLTHGWRRFVWKEFLKTNVHKKERFLPEKGVFITGKTTIFKKPFATKRSMTSLTFLEDGVYQEKKFTNDQGRFSFGPFAFKDTISTVIQAVFPEEKNKKKNKNISIFIDAPSPGPPFSSYDRETHTSINIDYLKRYLAEARRQKVADFKYNPEATLLDEVVLQVKKKTIAEKVNSKYGHSQKRLFISSIPGGDSRSVIDLLRQIPGVNVVGSFPNVRIEIRGGGIRFSQPPPQPPTGQSQQDQEPLLLPPSGPLILVDDVETPIDFISNLWGSDVLFIDILRSEQSLFYGSRGSEGVILIYTRRGTDFFLEQERSPGITNFKTAGFYQAREFFSPDYSTKEPEHYIPDYRTTLHWEPYIYTNGNDKASIDFYASDSKGKYIIKIEGVTYDGRVIKNAEEISIQ